ncbi:MAG: two-component sensor histidine kinase, partial [Gammaproteobacteria bacterium]|nr:two-component sensor histidine kinase [Gammaproteobacteria bacterium]
GLYAQIIDGTNRSIWSSPSGVGLEIPYPTALEPGKAVFAEVQASDGSHLFGLAFAVIWEVKPGIEHRYLFRVAESRSGFEEQVSSFRRTLWLWLAGAAVVLLAVQGVILAWSLTPLRRAAQDVHEIETGERAELSGTYPRELQPLTDNLNALIRSSRAHLQRYRDALDDLAHSLKTPLAVLRNSIDEAPAGVAADTIREQIERMDHTVAYQLQRAAASGRRALAAPLPVKPVADSIFRSLEKVYRDKAVTARLQIDSGAYFSGDEGDLTEIIGNIADNAYKWCQGRVELKALPSPQGEPRLLLEVADDGPGIPESARKAILNRGVRADTFTSGHGIGLAVVREIVEEVYSGKLEVGDSPLGGTLIRVLL